MITIEQPLLKILNDKNKFIDALLKDFEGEFGKVSSEVLVKLKSAYKMGAFDYDTVLGIFTDAGYPAAVQGYVEQYTGVMDFIKREAEYMDISFALSEAGLDLVGFMQEQHAAGLIKGMEKYAQTLVEMGVKHTLEGTGFNQLVADLALELDKMGRNARLEVSEGIKTFDRAVHSEQMKEAGIERFVYVGPDDDVTRDACKAVLDDPRQETGWTRDDIAELPDVSFVGGGGWNCRHDWYPYIEEYK